MVSLAGKLYGVRPPETPHNLEYASANRARSNGIIIGGQIGLGCIGHDAHYAAPALGTAKTRPPRKGAGRAVNFVAPGV